MIYSGCGFARSLFDDGKVSRARNKGRLLLVNVVSADILLPKVRSFVPIAERKSNLLNLIFLPCWMISISAFWNSPGKKRSKNRLAPRQKKRPGLCRRLHLRSPLPGRSRRRQSLKAAVGGLLPTGFRTFAEAAPVFGCPLS